MNSSKVYQTLPGVDAIVLEVGDKTKSNRNCTTFEGEDSQEITSFFEKNSKSNLHGVNFINVFLVLFSKVLFSSYV